MAVVYFRLFNRHDNAFLNLFWKSIWMSSNLRSFVYVLWQAWKRVALLTKAQRCLVVVVVRCWAVL
jgi:hypothetical protein